MERGTGRDPTEIDFEDPPHATAAEWWLTEPAGSDKGLRARPLRERPVAL